MGALAGNGVFVGTECAEGMLCPGEPIDRKTMAVWTVRALDGQDPAQIPNSRFSDVAADSFHGPFIERMAELGVTGGCGDGTGFCPDGTVTRDQMAVFLTRAFDLGPGPDPGFSDVAADAWYYDQVAALAASGITAGCGDGTTFCPRRQTTRAQMATFLARATGLVPLPTPTPATATYKAVTAGSRHTCALRTDNTITCWGAPADAPTGTFKAVSAGGGHSCGLRSDDTITCWGYNSYGQADAPAGTFNAIAAGSNAHSCGLRSDDTITCWGADDYGQADAPAGAFKTVTVGGESYQNPETLIVRHRGHSCGLRSDDTITCWGADEYGQADAPTGTFKTVAAGSNAHSCGLRSDDTIACWGNNWTGLADAPAGTFKAIAVGASHACGLRSDGTITCWGYNSYGQADAPAGTFKSVTAGGWEISGLQGPILIGHSCGLRTDGTITCWGFNGMGQADAPTDDP